MGAQIKLLSDYLKNGREGMIAISSLLIVAIITMIMRVYLAFVPIPLVIALAVVVLILEVAVLFLVIILGIVCNFKGKVYST